MSWSIEQVSDTTASSGSSSGSKRKMRGTGGVMKYNFDLAVDAVLAHEGGYVEDPHDPGGATKWGISNRSYPDIDIAKLTKADARDIYHNDYWQAMRCDELPSGLDLLVFDAAVNQGQGAATIMLQQAVGAQVDGIIGPRTMDKAQVGNIENAIRELVALRAVKYGNIATFPRYGLGWMRRLAYMHQRALEIA
jgi:lysozyme family protein